MGREYLPGDLCFNDAGSEVNEESIAGYVFETRAASQTEIS
jgi:hypothetical protein